MFVKALAGALSSVITLNNLRHSAAHSGSSVHDTHAVIVSFHFSSVLRVCRIWLLMPRSFTGVPALSTSCFVPSPCTVNGDPPPHSWYISGLQMVPSKSNAISFGSRFFTELLFTFELFMASPKFSFETKMKSAKEMIWMNLQLNMFAHDMNLPQQSYWILSSW